MLENEFGTRWIENKMDRAEKSGSFGENVVQIPDLWHDRPAFRFDICGHSPSWPA